MDLKDIISISGKSGLFKVVGKSKNNVIVESIIDKKRFPIFNSNKISAFQISVFIPMTKKFYFQIFIEKYLNPTMVIKLSYTLKKFLNLEKN